MGRPNLWMERPTDAREYVYHLLLREGARLALEADDGHGLGLPVRSRRLGDLALALLDAAEELGWVQPEVGDD